MKNYFPLRRSLALLAGGAVLTSGTFGAMALAADEEAPVAPAEVSYEQPVDNPSDTLASARQNAFAAVDLWQTYQEGVAETLDPVAKKQFKNVATLREGLRKSERGHRVAKDKALYAYGQALAKTSLENVSISQLELDALSAWKKRFDLKAKAKTDEAITEPSASTAKLVEAYKRAYVDGQFVDSTSFPAVAKELEKEAPVVIDEALRGAFELPKVTLLEVECKVVAHPEQLPGKMVELVAYSTWRAEGGIYTDRGTNEEELSIPVKSGERLWIAREGTHVVAEEKSGKVVSYLNPMRYLDPYGEPSERKAKAVFTNSVNTPLMKSSAVTLKCPKLSEANLGKSATTYFR